MIVVQTSIVFFFNDTATTEIYTLSLHDALPISSRRFRIDRPAYRSSRRRSPGCPVDVPARRMGWGEHMTTPVFIWREIDRKSTRLNSSHANISYAVFCLKKKIIISTLHVFLSLH